MLRFRHKSTTRRLTDEDVGDRTLAGLLEQVVLDLIALVNSVEPVCDKRG